MAEKVLDGPDVATVLAQVGGERVAEGVAGRSLWNARSDDRTPHGVLAPTPVYGKNGGTDAERIGRGRAARAATKRFCKLNARPTPRFVYAGSVVAIARGRTEPSVDGSHSSPNREIQPPANGIPPRRSKWRHPGRTSRQSGASYGFAASQLLRARAPGGLRSREWLIATGLAAISRYPDRPDSTSDPTEGVTSMAFAQGTAAACASGRCTSSAIASAASSRSSDPAAHHELVTEGSYRWVRHPSYLGMLLGLRGVGARVSASSRSPRRADRRIGAARAHRGRAEDARLALRRRLRGVPEAHCVPRPGRLLEPHRSQAVLPWKHVDVTDTAPHVPQIEHESAVPPADEVSEAPQTA